MFTTKLHDAKFIPAVILRGHLSAIRATVGDAAEFGLYAAAATGVIAFGDNLADWIDYVNEGRVVQGVGPALDVIFLDFDVYPEAEDEDGNRINDYWTLAQIAFALK